MLQEDEIKLLIGDIVKKYREYDENGVLKRKNVSAGKTFWNNGKKEFPYPEYYDGYNMLLEQVEDILPHAERGHFPEKLFKERSPNQTDEELKYIKNNFKQPTLSVYKDLVNTINRAFNEGNYQIDYEPSDETDQFREYVEGEIKNFGSYLNFVKFIVSPKKIVDANALITYKPVDLDIVVKEDGTTEIGDEPVKPTPFYYGVNQVVGYSEDDYYIIELDKKSTVMYAGKPKRMGKIYEVYDDKNIWHVTQTGKYTDWEFNYTIYYPHDLEYVPAIRTKGLPVIYKGELFYNSPFTYAIDPLDLVLLDTANLQISKAKCVYPYRIILAELCDFEDADGHKCNNGTVEVIGDLESSYKCRECRGTGLRSRVSPSGELLLRPKDRGGDDDTQLSQPPIQYVAPDVTSLEFLSEQIEKNMRSGRKILHLETDSKETNGAAAVTATEKGIDLKATYAFIKPTSDQNFAIFDFGLETMGKMRYGNSFKSPIVHAPKTFDFKTTMDHVGEIKQAIEVGMPPSIVHSLMLGYLNSVFYDQTQAARVFNLIVESDRLLTASDDEIRMKLMNGTALVYEEILHSSAVNLISELLAENESFFDQDLDKQKEQLIDLAKEKEKEISDSTQSAITDQILSDAEESGQDNQDEGQES